MRTKEEQKAIEEALTEIAESNDGRLTADAVVAAAAKKDSVLHALFEWDSKKAAHQYRLDQARSLIRSVRVNITTHKTVISTVAYVRDPDLKPDEQGYVSTMSLIGNAERSRSVLVDEFSRAAAAMRRAKELEAAFEMDGEIEAVTNRIDDMRSRIVASVEHRNAA